MPESKAARIFPPGEHIKEELEARGWNQADLAKFLGRTPAMISLIITGKIAITPDTAKQLARVFGTDPEFWMNLDTAYRLSLTPESSEQIEKWTRIYNYAPVKEMYKRGWISSLDDPDQIEKELCPFFKVRSINDEPQLEVAARASAKRTEAVTRAQLAWCYRSLHLASCVPAQQYRPESLARSLPELRSLATRAELVKEVPRFLGGLGIRFVVVEHLSRTKIDGAALWLNDSPVIAVSARHDRIDNFWHTLSHEVFHILHKDGYRLDLDLCEKGDENDVDQIERRADEEATNLLIPHEALKSFVLRVSPFYRKDRIVQFANRHKIHPGIVVGQLQHLGEVSWRANKEMLVSIRHLLTNAALTDGWGCEVNMR